ncbi:hypothetical protein KGK29_004550 [Salmonella enterica]|nr:hypothetical protein [Salmonella enterica]
MRDDEIDLLLLFWADFNDVTGVEYFDLVDFGLNPREYGVLTEQDLGITATLDFKVWNRGKLVCYFFDEHKERKFKISLFPEKETEGYFPKEGGIDFSELGLLGELFHIGVGINGKGNPVFLSAERTGDNPEYEC